MANYWAITIGINQYRHLQPLMHAQDDARFVHYFFAAETDTPADHCVLLSDLGTSAGQQAVYPDKPAIVQGLQTIAEQVGIGDVMWFFFSGYGAQVKNENGQAVDYLMPIDGDPGQIESTGIAVAGLIDTLAHLPTDKVLLVLDINRAQGAMSGQAIGTQIIDLAQKHNVATLLSCQPEQYSHETLGVRHGLFTAALLEALHQDCKTIDQISDFINQRLPELCDHHWRPVQNPVSLVPDNQKLASVVPEISYAVATEAVESTEALTVEPTVELAEPDAGEEKVVSTEKPSVEKASTAGMGAVSSGAVAAGGLSIAPPVAIGAGRGVDIEEDAQADTVPDIGRQTASLSLEPPLIEPPQAEKDSTSADRSMVDVDTSQQREIGGAKLRNWGLLALAVLMGGVLLKQPFVKTAWEGWTRSAETPVAASSGGESVPPAENADTTAVVPSAASVAEPSVAEPLTAESSTAESVQEAEGDAEKTGVVSEPVDEPAASESAEESASESVSDAEKAAAQSLLNQAKAAVEQRQFSEALIALQQVPRSLRDETFSSVLTSARAGAAEAQQANASVLTEARTAIQPTQASQFTEAITKARLIQPGEPYYEAAQNDIQGWSQIILDIAEGRATSGNLDGAIAAAGVMPYDNAEFHKKAQDRIAFWQQRQQSRNIISEAQKIPKLGVASTYQQGIVKLREVPIEHPEYESAQRLADQWSESIFSIAQARAAQGRQSAAIQAAVLVPAGTTAYEPTQKAIRRWRSESQGG